ncbi:MAG TPA: SgcJ/EcaC family oxidoreductase [Candidatus Dormibacteraeota bacterium]|nr:SgcJ/EcaC family oxidoreductase [Candidatus Dormibacteraeota bacterium]
MSTQVSATRQVFDHHVGALLSGDLDGVVADYTDESVIIGPEGVLKGRESIREMFAGLFATLFRPGTFTVVPDVVHVDGEAAFVIWHANCVGADVVFAADTFIVKEGKITLQTFAPKIEPHS